MTCCRHGHILAAHRSIPGNVFIKEMNLKLTISIAVVFFVSLLVGSDSGAQTGALTKDPTEVLKKYLALEAHGARLEAISWESEKPYVAWKQEPFWGHAIVITEYKIMDRLADWEVRGNLDVVIPVEFKVLGRLYWEQAHFMSDPKTERVGFHIKAVNSMWRIIDPMLPPHVSQKRMISYVREAMVAETDSVRLEKLTALRDDVRKARE
jgi:hypothetical protein